MKRREFIILGGIGATSASLLSACGHPEEKLIPALIPDEEYVPGIDNWKASTCGMCHAGCGIIVRTREHKANKIEGNPLHPVNRGALCARGQAGLEVLYNPDRIKGPMKRAGERGEGKWEEITWEEGIKTLADKLREIGPNSSTERATFHTTEAEGVTAHVAGRFMQAYGQALVAAPFDANTQQPRGFYTDLLRDVVKPGEPIFDIANATFLISFRARFLETWKSPVMYSRAYGEFRSGHGKARGRFVHVEPRMSLTGANADEWVAAAPGTEALVALAMVQVIVREGLRKAPVSPESVQRLAEFSPEVTASVTDMPPERIIRLAREFAGAQRPLAIGDLRTPAAAAVNLLNATVENLNKPGGVVLVESPSKSGGPLKIPGDGLIFPGESNEQLEKAPPHDGIERVSRFFQTFQRPNRILMIHGFNPMFEMHGWRKDLDETPFIVCFSSFIDETSELADLILPDHSYLERWDIHYSHALNGERAISLTQPVIEVEHNTRQTADVLLAVARELGGEVAAALPFETARDIVEKSANDVLAGDGTDRPEQAWSELTEKGVGSAGSLATGKSQASEPVSMELNTFLLGLIQRNAFDAPTSAGYPLTLIVYEGGALGAGSAANLPSIQELPDPMTSVMWGSWVEINPKTASSLGIADGDLVEVTTEEGSLSVPAVLYPGIRPDVIAMPLGQGHTKFGRYARNCGVNPRDLNPRLQENVRANVAKVSGKANLIRFGTDLQEHMEKKPWR